MSKRKRSAQSTIELIAGVIVLIPIVFALIDLSIIVLAAFKNDSICREACRAAASGDPSQASRLAQAEIDKYNTPGGFAKFKLAAPPSAQNVEMPPSGHGLVSGSVCVQTQAEIHAPFIVGFFAPTFTADSTQSFPYTYSIP